MQENFKVPDVSCGHCKAAIETALGTVEGIQRADVDVEGKSVGVDYDDSVVDRTAVVRAIESAGYSVGV